MHSAPIRPVNAPRRLAGGVAVAKAAPAVHVHVPLPHPVLELACALALATGVDVIALETVAVPPDQSMVHGFIRRFVNASAPGTTLPIDWSDL